MVTLSFTVYVTDIVSTRESKIGSTDVNQEPSTAYGYLGLNIESVYDTFTIGAASKAVRQYNIDRYLAETSLGSNILPGAVSRVLNGAGDILNAGLGVYQDVVDFIYGRNLVLPADAAYAQFSTGNPAFAEGTEAFEILQQKNLSKESAVYGRTAGKIASKPTYSKYTDNFDEYPYVGVYASVTKIGEVGGSTKASTTELVVQELSKTFNVPESELRADSDNIIGTTSEQLIREERIASLERNIAQKASYAIFQVGVGKANSTVRKRAYEDGKYKVFPNEIFSSGVLGLQYTRGGPEV